MERAELKSVLRATGCAVEHAAATFLCDPHWPKGERDEATRQMAAVAKEANADTGWLCIRTGGTGGAVKFARHDEVTLSAAVRGFCAHFKVDRVNAVDVLPAHHVSGLMARVRCAAAGGRHVVWDWKRMEAGDLPEVTGDAWCISLVPTQLRRLLDNASTTAWLRQFQMILVGGGPVWPALAGAAASAELRVSLTYGMTETAAMIAALPPAQFLAGARSCGTVMPHARIVVDESSGVLTVGGESVFRGYWPERSDEREFATGDLARIDDRGHLHILGRRDAVIITGGKKVNPAEVEAALRASGEFQEVAVIGVPDDEWGEAVVACYPREESRRPNLTAAAERLAGYQRPKRFVPISDWPRNAQGKVNRAVLRAAVERENER